MSKAAQGVLLRRTLSTPQTEACGEHSSSEKEPFMVENYLVASNILFKSA
jgi:hypothetical protein